MPHSTKTKIHIRQGSVAAPARPHAAAPPPLHPLNQPPYASFFPPSNVFDGFLFPKKMKHVLPVCVWGTFLVGLLVWENRFHNLPLATLKVLEWVWFFYFFLLFLVPHPGSSANPTVFAPAGC